MLQTDSRAESVWVKNVKNEWNFMVILSFMSKRIYKQKQEEKDLEGD